MVDQTETWPNTASMLGQHHTTLDRPTLKNIVSMLTVWRELDGPFSKYLSKNAADMSSTFFSKSLHYFIVVII